MIKLDKDWQKLYEKYKLFQEILPTLQQQILPIREYGIQSKLNKFLKKG